MGARPNFSEFYLGPPDQEGVYDWQERELFESADRMAESIGIGMLLSACELVGVGIADAMEPAPIKDLANSSTAAMLLAVAAGAATYAVREFRARHESGAVMPQYFEALRRNPNNPNTKEG